MPIQHGLRILRSPVCSVAGNSLNGCDDVIDLVSIAPATSGFIRVVGNAQNVGLKNRLAAVENNMLVTEKQDTSSKPHATTDQTRILHLINGEHFSGAERVQDLLALSLPQFGYGADFACLKANKFPKVRQSASDLFEVDMKNGWDFFCYRDVVRIVRSGGYKAMHAHTPRTLMIGALAARELNVPLIYHVHSPVGRDSTRPFQNKINTWVEKFSLKMVTRIICVSNSLAAYMKELGHDPNKICVVNNGVPAANDLPDRCPPDSRWTIGTMALFRPRKGNGGIAGSIGATKKTRCKR